MNHYDNMGTPIMPLENNSVNNSNRGYDIPDATMYTHDNLSRHVEKNDHIKKVTKEILYGLSKNDIDLSETRSLPSNSKIEVNKYMIDVNDDKKNDCLGNKMQYVIDFFVIYFLYLIMSTNMVKDIFADRIDALNPDDEGKINCFGIIIYGFIFAILCIIIKLLISFI
jgi:hypothetical protein